MIRYLWPALMICCASLSACSERADANPAPTIDIVSDAAPIPPEMESEAVTRFVDILADYQALNARLDTVAQSLQRANVALCPVTVRDPGYSVHSLGDYPAQLQEVARGLLNVDGQLSIRTVRAGTSAERSGLQRGDRLVGVNGTRFAGGHTQRLFYDRAVAAAYAGRTAELTIARGKDLSTVTLSPETLCGYPAYVFFDENVNGHTDGEAVWITSELMRTVTDDGNLALIVAHEMAHAMAGHMDEIPSQDLELQADAMALIMMARAGYDIDAAIAYWQRAAHPHHNFQDTSLTHPSITARLSNFKDTAAKIKAATRDAQPLDFTVLD